MKEKILFLLGIVLCFDSTLAYGPISDEEVFQRLKKFDYQQKTIKPQWRYILQNTHYQKFHGQYEVGVEQEKRVTVQFYLYRNKKAGNLPVILLFPPIGGISLPDVDLANYFTKRGFHIVIASLTEEIADYSRPVSDIDGFLVRSTIASRSLLDLMEQLPYVDHSKMAGMGLSLGGIRLSLLMGVDKRLKGSVVLVAGGDLPAILSLSREPRVKKWRKKRMQEHGVNKVSAFEKLLRQHSLIDPLHFARLRSPKDFFMFIGKKDTYVPTANQYLLWETLDQPRRLEFSLGHYPAAMTYRFHLKDILGFFNEKLRL